MANFKRIIVFLLLITFAFVIGFSNEVKKLKQKNEELSFRVKELELAIEEYEKLLELRNLLDIKSRGVIAALYDKYFSKIDLLNDNISVFEDKLVLNFDGYSTELPFSNGNLDYEKLRQRYFYFDNEKFVTGYEIVEKESTPNDIRRAVIVFSYIEADGWKLYNIEMDR
ncbi:MAG: hypothetical protein GXW85_01395 [Clostridia bacterium]|nr:hypothetical protein [Clostridia bacterium]